MAIATTDPTKPRDPGTLSMNDPANLSAAVKPLSPMPNAATGIATLPDGVGGAVPVPPTGMAPPSVGIAPPASPNINLIPSAGATTLPGAAPAAPAVDPRTQGAFTADSNLINQQINPTSSTRLLNTQGMTDQALNQVLNGPDRFALAQDKYDTFAQNAQNNFGHALTDATNAAASHGQIGSRMLTNRYGDLTNQFKLADNTARSSFLNDALTGTIGDRLNNLGATQGVENSIYGQDANARNELRGERGYQQNLAQQAIAQRIQQQQLEQGAQAQSFNQGLDLYGLGTRYDPTSAYLTAAGQASGDAASNSADVGALLRYYAMNRGGY